jgi:hypothetical protein
MARFIMILRMIEESFLKLSNPALRIVDENEATQQLLPKESMTADEAN